MNYNINCKLYRPPFSPSLAATRGTTLVVNRPSARLRETPRIGCSLRSQCLLGALVARLLPPIKVLWYLCGKKKGLCYHATDSTSKSHCACPNPPMRAQALLPYLFSLSLNSLGKNLSISLSDHVNSSSDTVFPNKVFCASWFL